MRISCHKRLTGNVITQALFNKTKFSDNWETAVFYKTHEGSRK